MTESEFQKLVASYDAKEAEMEYEHLEMLISEDDAMKIYVGLLEEQTSEMRAQINRRNLALWAFAIAFATREILLSMAGK